MAVVAVAFLLIAVLVVPPMVSVSRYKNSITQLIATSLGRPVRLSSVELRLLPWPGFVLSDLSVAEDPAYGAEPVLHATSVTASIRLLSLWRGRLEIGSISMDDASLNLVRSGPGRWNLDPLFRTAAQAGGARGNSSRRAVPPPSLSATHSRINVKNGAEKLPFSLINTDIEFWQDSPGEWRVRLRGQPARTDVSLYQEDTGVLRLEATVRSAAALREMPVQLDLDWREAQLGQLARLTTGSDPGWRGDVTGELHLEGTANAAHITTRLRATGVHRAEFAPAEPMDFDANCSLVYHYARRALENLECDSPLGDGRVRVTGEMLNGSPHLSLELDHVPVAAGLDALRTLRSDLPSDLDARGTVSGSITYAPVAGAAQSETADRAEAAVQPSRRAAKAPPMPPGPLAGALNVQDFALSGAGMSQPIQSAKIVLQPASVPLGLGNSQQALTGTMSLPAGGSVPLSLNLQLTRSGYQITVHGPASIARARELFGAAGLAGPAGVDSLAGDSLAVDLSAEGPWLQAEEIPPGNLVAGAGPLVADADPNAAAPPPLQTHGADTLSGTVTMRNANWRADFLANHVQISQATLHLDASELRWGPVVFSYGPVKGTASLAVPLHCDGPEPCPPHFEMHFGDLDAATLQTAILGVQQKGTLFSALIDRLHPSSAPPWPRLEGSVQADSLVLGPVTLESPSVTLRTVSTGAEIADLSASLLGGRVLASGTFTKPAGDADKPAYTLDCHFENLNPKSVGEVIGQRWSGGDIDANGKVELTGYTDKDLAGSAKGTLHFEWRHGAVTGAVTGVVTPNSAADPSAAANPPAVLAHFELWTADASIGDNAVAVDRSAVRQGSHTRSVAGTLTFGDPPKISFGASKEARVAGASNEAR
jgi:hypothetical protein